MASSAPVIDHEYTLGQIIGWWWRGQYQHILWRIPGVNPRRDPTYPPSWWYRWWTLYEWTQNHHATTWRPYLWCIQRWQEGARLLLGQWIDEVGDWAKAFAIWKMYDVVGRPKHGERLVYTFLRHLDDTLGVTLPPWALTVAAGLLALYDWFPSDVTAGLASFYDKFVAWYNATLGAAATLYGAAKDWVANVAPGLVNRFEIVRSWFDRVGTWVTNFKNNPYATVVGLLGTAWTAWTGMKDDMVDFYNNVWVPFKITLHDFLADPTGWMYDRVEDELCRRW